MSGILGYGEPADWGSDGIDGVTGGQDWGDWTQKTAQSVLSVYAGLKTAELQAKTAAVSKQDGTVTADGQRQGVAPVGSNLMPWLMLGGAALLVFVLVRR